MTTGFVFHESYLWHRTFYDLGPYFQEERHFENPETKRRFRNLLAITGLLDDLVPLSPRPATVEELLRFHDPAYVERIRAMSNVGGGDAGEDAPFGRGSYEIALLSAGGVITAVDAVLDGTVDNVYALVRPPGHHAESDRGRGYCLFNNAVLAALHARERHGLRKMAVLDWDVHHGNGTEAAFWSDPSVLTISIHQSRNYPPDTGAVEDRGGGDGYGYNINVPLPPGSGGGAYLATFDRIVEPALRAHQPELIFVACGFDAGAFDPLGRMMLTSDHYAELTRRMMSLAGELCSGRLVFSHEGGYSTYHVPFCGLRVIEELSGIHTGVEDPVGAMIDYDYQELQPGQERIIAAVEGAIGAPP